MMDHISNKSIAEIFVKLVNDVLLKTQPGQELE